MCWDTEVNPVSPDLVEAAIPLKAGEYDLCWNVEEGLPKVDLAPIHQPDTGDNETIDITIPFGAGQYNMCWNDHASAVAMGYTGEYWSLALTTVAKYYSGDFDMCWGDSPSAGDDHLENGSIAAPVINLVKSGGFKQYMHVGQRH